VFKRLRSDVARAQVKQDPKRAKAFAARVIRVNPSKVIAAFQTEDGQGLAVYYYPPVKVRGTVWLLRVGYDGALHGQPIVFPPGADWLDHEAAGRWREV
jgi:hypothetical protein